MAMDTPRAARILGMAALVGLGAACLLVLRPFISALLWAIILAFSTWPVFEVLRDRLRLRPGFAAAIMVAAMFLLIGLPIVLAAPTSRDEVEALRALTYRAVESYVSGKDVTKLASMAKLKAGRLTREVADSCLQYWGGMGFTADNPISQSYRDGRLISIGGGADEIMLGIICKLEGTLPGKKE